jgi:hypothetical protein
MHLGRKHFQRNDFWLNLPACQGCQICLGTKKQNGENVPKLPQKYQMAIQFTKMHKIYVMAMKYTKIFHHMAFKYDLKLSFWYTNKSFGNPAGCYFLFDKDPRNEFGSGSSNEKNFRIWSQSYDFGIYNYNASVVVSSLEHFFNAKIKYLFSKRTSLLLASKNFTAPAL